MSETSSSSSGAGSTSTTLPTITDAQIQTLFPNIVFSENPGPNDPQKPTPPDNFWASVGWFVAGEVNWWVFKKFGWLLVLEAIEPIGPED